MWCHERSPDYGHRRRHRHDHMGTWIDTIMHIEEDEEANIDEGMIGNMDVNISITDVAFEKDDTDRGKAFKKSVSKGIKKHSIDYHHK